MPFEKVTDDSKQSGNQKQNKFAHQKFCKMTLHINCPLSAE